MEGHTQDIVEVAPQTKENVKKEAIKDDPLKKHDLQWVEMENAIHYVCDSLGTESSTVEAEENLFLHDTVTVMEKFNGTNIALDKFGQVYSRKCLLPDDIEDFIHTSLKCVRNQVKQVGNIANILTTEEGIGPKVCINILVYGELMCKHVTTYDEFAYDERGILGKWIPFGCLLEIAKDKEPTEVLDILRKAGFAARMRDTDAHKNQIQLFMNRKLLENLELAGIDVELVNIEETTVFKMVKDKKESMKKGRVEGYVITFMSEKRRWKIIKWKGATEIQPRSKER